MTTIQTELVKTSPTLSQDTIFNVGDYVSEADYWAYYYEHGDHRYEWNNGILEEKPVADYLNNLIYRWFVQLLEQFLLTNPIAKMTNLDIGFRMALPNEAVIRKPDIALILNDNPVDLHSKDRSYQGIYDICIESLSDSTKAERERDTIRKKGEYQQGGIKEYYILHDSEKHRAFYRLIPTGQYVPLIPTAEGVIQSTVLPGFQFRLADLESRPSLLALTEDPIYQSFVWLEYQAEKARADNAEQELARLMAELQAHGIDLPSIGVEDQQ